MQADGAVEGLNAKSPFQNMWKLVWFIWVVYVLRVCIWPKVWMLCYQLEDFNGLRLVEVAEVPLIDGAAIIF